MEFIDAVWGPTTARLRRFAERTVLVAGAAYLMLAGFGHESSPNDALISLALGLMAGLAQRWRRTQHETVAFQAPFGLREQLIDPELAHALDATLRYRENPDDTGLLDLRATVAHAIRQKTPGTRRDRRADHWVLHTGPCRSPRVRCHVVVHHQRASKRFLRTRTAPPATY